MGAEDMGKEHRQGHNAGTPWLVYGTASARIPELETMTATDVRRHLHLLFEERGLAIAAGLGNDRAYMADLADEIAATRAAWVGVAITEIASLRGQLGDRQHG
jgi:hypothetical protein